MKVLMRLVAVLFVLIAAFLVYAVIHAATSSGGARWGVAAGYIVGAVLLSLGATWLWSGRRGKKGAPAGIAS